MNYYLMAIFLLKRLYNIFSTALIMQDCQHTKETKQNLETNLKLA